MEKIVIIGAGPHSKVIIDIFERMKKYQIVGLSDSVNKGNVFGYPILGKDDILQDIKKDVDYAFIAIGDNNIRKKLFYSVLSLGFKIVNAISPDAVVSKHVNLGTGIAIMPGAVVNAGSIIGDGSIINTNVSVDHDCIIGKFVHIAPGCAVSGSTKINDECFIGTGSKIINNIKIGEKTIIGAGGVVIKNFPPKCMAVGIPAKIIKNL